MKDLRISSQLFVGFGLMVLLVLASSTMVWLEAYRSEARGEVARRSTTGAVALADAQSALWQLRYGFPQFMISEEAGRKKIVNDEPAFRASVDKALDAYAASNPSEEERRSLKALRDIYGKYMAARPDGLSCMKAARLKRQRNGGRQRRRRSGPAP